MTMENKYERPLGSLLSELAQETTLLVRKEVELARAEMSEKVSEATTGVTSLAAGGAVAFCGLIFLLLSATYALALVMDAWLAALIVGVVTLVVGLGVLAAGRSKLSARNLQPRRTIQTLQEDTQWARAQIKRP